MSIRQEIHSIMQRDPAAKSWLEVILCYPSFHALLWYRLNHWLWTRVRFRIIARMLSQIAQFFTGIEIHPGALIGKNLFIDHGTGVVIGETTVIGDNVTLYQSVTLGGVRPSEQAGNVANPKRHPTLCDGVVVGAGAKILGNITIGENARVGANAVVLGDVIPHATVVGVPAVVVRVNDTAVDDFMPYGCDDDVDCEQCVESLIEIRKEMEKYRNRIRQLEKSLLAKKASSKKTTAKKTTAKKASAKKTDEIQSHDLPR